MDIRTNETEQPLEFIDLAATSQEIPLGLRIVRMGSGQRVVAQLLGRAEKGDVTVLAQLRQLLDESPELWRGYGNLAAQAQANWVQLAAGTNLLLAESLMRKAAELRSELAGPSPSPLE